MVMKVRSNDVMVLQGESLTHLEHAHKLFPCFQYLGLCEATTLDFYISASFDENQSDTSEMLAKSTIM